MIIFLVWVNSAESVGTGVYSSTQWPQFSQSEVRAICERSVLFDRTVAHCQGSSTPFVKKILVPALANVRSESKPP